MSPEEMAKALRDLGWSVTEPITKQNCKHPADMIRGSVSVGSEGYKSDTTCIRCGQRWTYESPPIPNQQSFWIQNDWNKPA